MRMASLNGDAPRVEVELTWGMPTVSSLESRVGSRGRGARAGESRVSADVVSGGSRLRADGLAMLAGCRLGMVVSSSSS